MILLLLGLTRLSSAQTYPLALTLASSSPATLKAVQSTGQYLALSVELKDRFSEFIPLKVTYNSVTKSLKQPGSLVYLFSGKTQDKLTLELDGQSHSSIELKVMLERIDPVSLDLGKVISLQNKIQIRTCKLLKIQLNAEVNKFDELDLLSTVNVESIESEFKIFAGLDDAPDYFKFDRKSIQTWGYGQDIFFTKNQLASKAILYFLVMVPKNGNVKVKPAGFYNFQSQLQQDLWTYDWVQKDFSKTYSAGLTEPEAEYLVTLHIFSGKCSLFYSLDNQKFSPFQDNELQGTMSYQAYILDKKNVFKKNIVYFKMSSDELCAYQIKIQHFGKTDPVPLRQDTKEYSYLQVNQTDTFQIVFSYKKQITLSIQVNAVNSKDKSPAVIIYKVGKNIAKTKQGQVYFTYDITQEECTNGQCMYYLKVAGPAEYLISYRLQGQTVFLTGNTVYQSYLMQNQAQEFKFPLAKPVPTDVSVSIVNVFGHCILQQSKGQLTKKAVFKGVTQTVKFSVIAHSDCQYQLQVTNSVSGSKVQQQFTMRPKEPRQFSLQGQKQTFNVTLTELTGRSIIVVQDVVGNPCLFYVYYSNKTKSNLFYRSAYIQTNGNATLQILNRLSRDNIVLVSYGLQSDCIVYPSEFQVSLDVSFQYPVPTCVQFLVGSSKQLTFTVDYQNYLLSGKNSIYLTVQYYYKIQVKNKQFTIKQQILQEACPDAPNLCSIKMDFQFPDQFNTLYFNLHTKGNIIELQDGDQTLVSEESSRVKMVYYLNDENVNNIRLAASSVKGKFSLDVDLAPISVSSYTFPQKGKGKFTTDLNLIFQLKFTDKQFDTKCYKTRCALLISVFLEGDKGAFNIEINEKLRYLFSGEIKSDFLLAGQKRYYQFYPFKTDTNFTVAATGVFSECAKVAVYPQFAPQKMEFKSSSVQIRSSQDNPLYVAVVQAECDCKYQIYASESSSQIHPIRPNSAQKFTIDKQLNFIYTSPSEQSFSIMALSASYSFRLSIAEVTQSFWMGISHLNYGSAKINTVKNQNPSAPGKTYVVLVQNLQAYPVNLSVLVLVDLETLNVHQDETYYLRFPGRYQAEHTCLKGDLVVNHLQGESVQIQLDKGNKIQILKPKGQLKIPCETGFIIRVSFKGAQSAQISISVLNIKANVYTLKVGSPQNFSSAGAMNITFLLANKAANIFLDYPDEKRPQINVSCIDVQCKYQLKKTSSGDLVINGQPKKSYSLMLRSDSWVQVLVTDESLVRLFEDRPFVWTTVPGGEIIFETKPRQHVLVQAFTCRGELNFRTSYSAQQGHQPAGHSKTSHWNYIALQSVESADDEAYYIYAQAGGSLDPTLQFLFVPQYISSTSPIQHVQGSPKLFINYFGSFIFLNFKYPQVVHPYKVVNATSYVVMADQRYIAQQISQCDPNRKIEKKDAKVWVARVDPMVFPSKSSIQLLFQDLYKASHFLTFRVDIELIDSSKENARSFIFPVIYDTVQVLREQVVAGDSSRERYMNWFKEAAEVAAIAVMAVCILLVVFKLCVNMGQTAAFELVDEQLDQQSQRKAEPSAAQ